MKRIIIPAGTVSGKKDYILEIPIDSNDQDENAIYILDDKSSKGSMKSLSDYFYDQGSGSQLDQEYMKKYLYQQNEEQGPHKYRNDDLGASYPSNYMLKQEFKPANYKNVDPQIQSDISQCDKYYYYKSLGFDESELHKLLDKNTGQRRVTRVPSQRKQMRFNRLGVSDFTSLNEDQNPSLFRYDSYSKQMSTPVGTTSINTYANVMSDGTFSNNPYNATTSFERTQGYYEDYPEQQQSSVNNMDARMYKQFPTPMRTPVPPTRNSVARSNQSYTSQQTTSSPPATGNKQPQNVYYQPRYYQKTMPSPKVSSASKTRVPNESTQNATGSQEKTVNRGNIQQNLSPDGSIISKTKMENYQQLPQNFPRHSLDPQKRIYRTLPGTSVVSNMPNIRIRNPVVS